jgi:hypothetical protein
MFLVYAIALAFVGYVIYLFFDFNKELSTTASVLLKDIKSLENRLVDIELSPWDEIDTLSRIGDSQSSKKIFGDVETAVLYSIYHEPILAYAAKRYLHDHTLSYAVKFDDQIYAVSPKNATELEVRQGEQNIATIDTSELSIKGKREQVKIYHEEGTDLLPVKFAGETKLLINAHEAEDVDQTRAIVNKESISPEERELFILVLSYALIDQLI